MKTWQVILLCLLWSLLAPAIFVYGLGMTGAPMMLCSFLWGIPMGLFCCHQLLKDI